MKKYFAVIIALIGLAVIIFITRPAPDRTSQTPQTFPSSTEGLPEAVMPQVVRLQGGDTFELRAFPVKKTIAGKEVRLLSYNGSIPGPILVAPQGSEVTINLKNEIGIPTTLHSHGVRLDNAFDGVPGVTQKEIAHGETFTYKVRFPDAGVFWYHPHMREDYSQELGMYGNYLISPLSDDFWLKADEEIPLFFDDLLLGENGLEPFYTDHVDRTLMGRFGNVMFTNGSTEYSTNVAKGSVVRFFMTNSSNTRVYNLSIPGVKLKLVGADGGKYEREQFVDSIILAPSERAIVEVLFNKPGSYRIMHTGPQANYVMGKIDVADTPGTPSPEKAAKFEAVGTNEDVIKDIDSFRLYFNKPADKRIAFTIDMMGMMQGGSMMNMMSSDGHNDHSHGAMMGAVSAGIEWEDHMPEMNRLSTDEYPSWKIVDQDSGKQNMDIVWNFKKGDVVKVSVFNDPNSMHPMQHPLHFHGQRFLILSRNGVRTTNFVWKDTALIQAGETVELLVDMSNPGTWMAHCHIAEHLHSGMMFGFNVEE